MPPNSGPNRRWTIASAECSTPGLCLSGLSPANIRPAFGALPVKLKPVTAKTLSISGTFLNTAMACLAMPVV